MPSEINVRLERPRPFPSDRVNTNRQILARCMPSSRRESERPTGATSSCR